METLLTLNKELFINKFLSPISKLTENVILNVESDNINTVCNSPDAGVILYAKLTIPVDIQTPLKLNLLDIGRLVRLVGCIETSGDITLLIKDNNISYKDKSFNFVYHLSDNGYIPKCSLDAKKINNLVFDTEFELPISKFNEIMKGASIVSDSNKLYLYTTDNGIYAELNDKETPNSNNITYLISDTFSGANITRPFPLNLEHIRLISGLKTDKLKVRYNNKFDITVFEILEDNILVKFVISALVK